MFIIHNGLKLSHKFNGNMKYLKKVFSRIDRNSIQYKKNGRLVQHF